MAFTIDDNIIRIYQDGIDSIINQLGKRLVVVNPRNDLNCPNCGFIKGRSNSRYITTNPNPLGPLNKPFADGQVCPVCQGQGKVKVGDDQTEIRATVEWEPKEEVSGSLRTVVFPRGVCKCKTFATNYKIVENAVEFLVGHDEPIEGSINLVRCKMFRNSAPRGLKYNRYIEFYLQRES